VLLRAARQPGPVWRAAVVPPWAGSSCFLLTEFAWLLGYDMMSRRLARELTNTATHTRDSQPNAVLLYSRVSLPCLMALD
jgi:hypothetical protein